jgi:hypothetical protein
MMEFCNPDCYLVIEGLFYAIELYREEKEEIA